jgi:hypothetical protein
MWLTNKTLCAFSEMQCDCLPVIFPLYDLPPCFSGPLFSSNPISNFSSNLYANPSANVDPHQFPSVPEYPPQPLD